ncbi:hypothetical protein Verru16b_00021 [Lacunisphaera limnophila]|uniref:DUF2851 domain-containing protein n=1 Tax=Lacunisphaera limnophila TaxID=1838286 RepID=A0A1I7PHB0_9BACT|nr:DUF2851 family protein [Lacunisphaera limnophila]AOS42985.1 hypothetical protein Verru16b_00021 [Lacunisphaera limnophila]
MATISTQVHEMQGLYGPYTMAERVVQKIWLRQDFDTQGLRLTDGRSLAVVRPGAWNLRGGPDFLGASLLMERREVTGDIEVHFHASDWRAHGHATDRAYDRVVLHVVLFPPPENQAEARSHVGEPLPTLVLLPRLHRGLEEYASDDALENLTARDTAEKIAELSLLPPADLREMLLRRARDRWGQKMRFAGIRLSKLGWTEAAHHTALEILGYRHNRAAMLAVAGRHPLAEWGRGPDLAAIYREADAAWQTQAVRPANHPRRRLQQYAAWVAARPDWPNRLKALPSARVSVGPSTRPVRQQLELAALREWVRDEITGGVLGGSRLDNLVCDGLLPLVAAGTGKDQQDRWFQWYLGDAPGEVRRALGSLGLAGKGVGPQTHGWAQGLLGWIIERDARASG